MDYVTLEMKEEFYMNEINYKLMCNMHVIKGHNFLEFGVSRGIINSIETHVIENTCTLVKGGLLASLCPSVYMYHCGFTGQIYVIFDIGGFYENLSRKCRFV